MTNLTAELRQRLARYPVATHPVEHATIRFNLGMALAESPTGSHADQLNAAIGEYAEALRIFTGQTHPRERSRVLCALGAAERELGLPLLAKDRFSDALELVDVDDAPAEVGTAANGLGLALMDLGDPDSAIAAYRFAQTAFASHPRQLASTLHNLGQGLSSAGTPEALEEAIGAYEQGLNLVRPETDGYVWASLHHARAVALMDLPNERTDHLREALRSETAALTVFTRRSHPFQYAIARNNMGVAYEELAPGDITMLRRALAALEEAVIIFDPRLHPEPSQHARANLTRVERSLDTLLSQELDRSTHFAHLAGAVSEPERKELLRTRLSMAFDLPPGMRAPMLSELADAIVRLDEQAQHAVTRTWMSVLMEQPGDHVREALESRQRADARLGPPAREISARSIEAALGELEVLQRVSIRDALTEFGHQRPGS